MIYHLLQDVVKYSFLTICIVILATVGLCKAQYTSKTYANHPALERRMITTPHFKIVYPRTAADFAQKISPVAENIFEAYTKLLKLEPNEKIILYLNTNKKLVSKVRASHNSTFEALWKTNGFFKCFNGNRAKWKYILRYKIANAFLYNISSSALGPFQAFLLSRPSMPLWSAGFPAYLSIPYLTRCDVQFLKNYWNVQARALQKQRQITEKGKMILGRSQIHFFNQLFSANLLQKLYSTRKSFLGIGYFDFNEAFAQTFGVPYRFFYNQWKKNQLKTYNDSLSQLPTVFTPPDTAAVPRKTEAISFESKPYHPFLNIQVTPPMGIPYYLNSDDFGLAGILRWKSPLNLHQIKLAGILALSDIADRSFFYGSYVNNSLGPRIKLSLKHYTSASGWLDLSVRRSNVAALSSLWKIDALSHDYSNWYAGFMLRYLQVDYFSPHDTEPNIIFDNRNTIQTDLRLVVGWRKLQPSTFNAVHPLKGSGFRLSATGSGPFLNSNTQYVRFYGEAFTLIPALGKHRIYLYAAGALDIDESIGADYLYFSESGDYELPEPKFIGSTGRAVEGFIRGYETPIVGEKFVWGTLEYRIPLVLNNKMLLGVLPLPNISLAVFTDAGVIGEARNDKRTGFTAYRFSVGTEVKTAFSFGGFSVAFKAGIAQALDQPFGPALYFTIQPAIPF